MMEWGNPTRQQGVLAECTPERERRFLSAWEVLPGEGQPEFISLAAGRARLSLTGSEGR